MKLEETLREQGLEIRYRHLRWIEHPDPDFVGGLMTVGAFRFGPYDAQGFRIAARGGLTEAVIIRPNPDDPKSPEVLAQGHANVNPSDVYCKVTGRMKAGGRAYSEFLALRRVGVSAI